MSEPPKGRQITLLALATLVAAGVPIAFAFATRPLLTALGVSRFAGSVALGPSIILTLLLSLIFRRRLAKAPAGMRLAVGFGMASGLMAAVALVDANLARAALSQPMMFAMPLGIVALAGGGRLLFSGLKGKRKGDSLHCPKCDYELGVKPAAAPIRCPECGTPWLGRWAVGRKVRSRAMIWAGVALLAPLPLVAAAMFTPMGNTIMTMLPTRVVLKLAALDAWGHNSAAWLEVNTRTLDGTLTPSDEARFAESLLDLRLRTDYLYGPPATWLESAVMNGASAGPLPDALRERYYAEWFQPRIDLPDQVPVGEARSIAVVGPTRAGGSTAWMHVWIDEIAVDGVALDPSGYRPSTTGGWTYSLYLQPASDMTPHFTGFAAPTPPALDTSAPGQHLITATLYECVLPRGPGPSGPPVSNGTPNPPIGSIEFRRVDIEKTVTIRPHRGS